MQGGSQLRWGPREGKAGHGHLTGLGLSTACSETGEVNRVYCWGSPNEIVLRVYSQPRKKRRQSQRTGRKMKTGRGRRETGKNKREGDVWGE